MANIDFAEPAGLLCVHNPRSINLGSPHVEYFMKKHFRYLMFPCFLFIMVLGSGFSLTSRAAPLDRPVIDPACMQSCQQEHFLCFVAAGGRNRDENHCLAEYRQCIAQCKH